MKRTFILIITGFMIWTGSYAQDVHFSQFFNSPMITNPALTGAFNAEHRLIANYRNQWGNVGKYTTYAFSYDAGLLKDRLDGGFPAVGLQFFYDKAGDLSLSNIQINLSAAYHLKLNENHYLTAGIQGGYSHRSINTKDMRWDSQYDPTMPDGYNPALPTHEYSSFDSYGFGDVSAGFLWTFNNGATNMSSNDMIKGNLGIACFHINQAKSRFINKDSLGNALDPTGKLSMKFTVHSNVLFGVPNTNMAIVPSLLLNFQGPAREYLFGSLFRFRLQEKSKYTNFVSETALSIGAHYRWADAVIATIMFEVKNWSIGVSYDINTSKLSAATKSLGGPEIALRYMTPIFKKTEKSLY